MSKEAVQLKEILAESFEVYTVDCKYGKIKASDMLDDVDVKGTSCNPSGQAYFLAQQNTELNISFGLCVGHDILFNMKSKVPTTTLIVSNRNKIMSHFKSITIKIFNSFEALLNVFCTFNRLFSPLNALFQAQNPFQNSSQKLLHYFIPIT